MVCVDDLKLVAGQNYWQRRVSFAFHSSGSFLRPKLTHQVARKSEVAAKTAQNYQCK